MLRFGRKENMDEERKLISAKEAADILDSLSSNEKDVLYLMIDGFDYKEIATLLNVDSKSVDNTIQRIKNKVKSIIEINKVSV